MHEDTYRKTHGDIYRDTHVDTNMDRVHGEYSDLKKCMNIHYLLVILDYIHYSLVIIITKTQGPQGAIASTVIQAT